MIATVSGRPLHKSLDLTIFLSVKLLSILNFCIMVMDRFNFFFSYFVIMKVNSCYMPGVPTKTYLSRTDLSQPMACRIWCVRINSLLIQCRVVFKNCMDFLTEKLVLCNTHFSILLDNFQGQLPFFADICCIFYKNYWSDIFVYIL